MIIHLVDLGLRKHVYRNVLYLIFVKFYLLIFMILRFIRNRQMFTIFFVLFGVYSFFFCFGCLYGK